MKKTLKILIIAFLLCILTYYCKIDSIPDVIFLYNDESIDIGSFPGIEFTIENENGDIVLTSGDLVEEENVTNTVDIKLFGMLTVKTVSLNSISKTTVIPVGQVSGLKLYTNGVLVVGLSEIEGENNQKYKPYENCEIQEGDTIIKINNEDIADTDNLIEIVNSYNGETLEIEYIHENEMKTCEIKPIKANDGIYKLGLWVRDSAAGIGTLTFYEPSSGNFAALGHGITDTDTGELINIQNGEFLTSEIISIVKGQKGNPRKNTRNNRRCNYNWDNIQK